MAAGNHDPRHRHEHAQGHGHDHGHAHGDGPAHAQGHAHDPGQGHAHAHGHDDHDDHGHGHGPGQAHGHGHGHGHGHHHHALPSRIGRAFLIGIALNLGFVLVEWGFGVFAHSLALLADATHNLGDVLGLAMAWAASRLGQRSPTRQFTYGLGASSILAALANGLLLVAVTGGLAWEAVLRLQSPAAVEGGVVAAVALAGVAVNGFTAWLLHHGHSHDLNVKGAYLHMLGDALVSVVVAVAGVLVLYTGWAWLDPVLSLAVGAVIVYGTLGLLRDAFKMALQGVPHNVDGEAVRAFLAQLPGVQQVHDLHIWAISTTENALTAHLVCPGGHPGDEFLASATRAVDQRFGIRHATLQLELGDCGRGCDED